MQTLELKIITRIKQSHCIITRTGRLGAMLCRNLCRFQINWTGAPSSRRSVTEMDTSGTVERSELVSLELNRVSLALWHTFSGSEQLVTAYISKRFLLCSLAIVLWCGRSVRLSNLYILYSEFTEYAGSVGKAFVLYSRIVLFKSQLTHWLHWLYLSAFFLSPLEELRNIWNEVQTVYFHIPSGQLFMNNLDVERSVIWAIGRDVQRSMKESDGFLWNFQTARRHN